MEVLYWLLTETFLLSVVSIVGLSVCVIAGTTGDSSWTSDLCLGKALHHLCGHPSELYMVGVSEDI